VVGGWESLTQKEYRIYPTTNDSPLTTQKGGSAVARLKDKYKDDIVSAMMSKFGYKNVMQVPSWKRLF